MKIREPAISDAERIRQIYLSAFGKEERDLVADLAIELLNTELNPGSLHLVADAGDEIVGHISFSPVTIKDPRESVGYILAPLAVLPGHQKRGMGSILVRRGLEQLATSEGMVVLVYGDPEYYCRFGFNQELARTYTTPFPLRYPLGWQALAIGGELLPGNLEKIACVESLNKPELW